MTVRLRGAEAVKAPPLLFPGGTPDPASGNFSSGNLCPGNPAYGAPAVLKIRCNFVIQKKRFPMQGLRPIISAYTRPRSVVAFIGALQQAFDLGVHVFPVFFGDLRRTGAEKGIAVDGYRLSDNFMDNCIFIHIGSIPCKHYVGSFIPK